MKNLFIVVLILVVGWLLFSRPTDFTTVQTEIDTLYKYDTFKITKKGKDIPYKVLDTAYLVDEVHDTTFILKDYAEVKAYSDTIFKDSNRFVINDTISRNKIQSRGFEALLAEKTIIRNNYIFTKEKGALYIGGFTSYDRRDGKLGLGLGLNYKTPKKDIFSLGYSTNVITIGYSKKIY
jgi:hypothetical protein